MSSKKITYEVQLPDDHYTKISCEGLQVENGVLYLLSSINPAIVVAVYAAGSWVSVQTTD